MGLIDRIRTMREWVEVGSGRSGGTHRSDLPRHYQIHFKQGTNNWSYDEQRGEILLNGEEVDTHLDFEARDVSRWSAVSSGLADYRSFVYQEHPSRFPEFVKRIDAIQDKILNQMKIVFDEKMNGVYLKWIEGVPFLNQMNIRAIMVMFQIKPTPKARAFLVGLKRRLALYLVSRSAKSRLDKGSLAVQELIQDVDSILTSTAGGYTSLASASSDSHA